MRLLALSFFFLQLDKSEMASGPTAMLEQATSSPVTGKEPQITSPAPTMHEVPPAFLALGHSTSPPFTPQHLGREPAMAEPVMCLCVCSHPKERKSFLWKWMTAPSRTPAWLEALLAYYLSTAARLSNLGLTHSPSLPVAFFCCV